MFSEPQAPPQATVHPYEACTAAKRLSDLHRCLAQLALPNAVASTVVSTGAVAAACTSTPLLPSFHCWRSTSFASSTHGEADQDGDDEAGSCGGVSVCAANTGTRETDRRPHAECAGH